MSEHTDRLAKIAADYANDPEVAHAEADAVLLDAVDPDVAAAYLAVQGACYGWWYA